MKMSGEEVIPAPREVVWKALNDPDVLRQSIPGCKSVTKLSDTEMEAAVTVALGPLKVNFKGQVTLTDLDPPKSYRISGQGSGGVAGNASGGANVRLDEVPEGTRLSYDVDAQVAGKLASMGARFIDPVSRKLAAQFFEKFATIAADASTGKG
jgi:carbon monoxide dehydrogenase subunit G